MKVSNLDSGVLLSQLKAPMDDRKRTITSDHDDGGPPNKRQATAANGAASKMDAEKEKDIENYQKEAIFRQLREYKRERNYLETQVSELTKRASHHDGNLRLINSWFSETLDELHASIKELPVVEKEATETFRSSLLAEAGSIWEEPLRSHATSIRKFVNDLQARLPGSSPEVRELQERIVTLLAAEKAHEAEVQKVASERDRLHDRLEEAMYRYLVAEKRLDRLKSTTVQKMEQQAIMKREDDGPRADDKAVKQEKAMTNGEADPIATAEAESARQVAVATADKRRDQIEQLEAENRRLADDLRSVKTRAATVTDDDYSKTNLFATSRSQIEDMIKRINDLKATNTQLQDEARRLQAERMSFRGQVEDESRASVGEYESQLARTEADLARIRNARDELTAEISILKGGNPSGSEQTLEALKELASAREARIKALESELERARLQSGESQPMITDAIDSLGAEDLKKKAQSLQQQYVLLTDEIESMQLAWRKTSAAAAKKILDMENWGEVAGRLTAEKAKADQKYFAAMKAKEAREVELRAIKIQSSKTSELITSVTQAADVARAANVTLEKGMVEAKEGLSKLEASNRTLQQRVSEGDIARRDLADQVSKMKALLSEKDTESLKAVEGRRKVEVELAESASRLDDAKKQVELIKKRTPKAAAAEADDWRRLAICNVCNSNLRNTVLKLCGHVFCNGCVQDLISNRSRKCPTCQRAFGNNDSMPITL